MRKNGKSEISETIQNEIFGAKGADLFFDPEIIEYSYVCDNLEHKEMLFKVVVISHC